MAQEWIAVVGCTVEPQGIVTGGTVSILGDEAPKVKADGKVVYHGHLFFTVSGASAPGYIGGTVSTDGTQNISATTDLVKAEEQFVMREKDATSANMTGTLIGGGQGFFSETYRISDANQNKVRAD